MRFNLKLDMIEIQPDSVIYLKTFLQLMVENYKCFSKEVFVIHGSDPHTCEILTPLGHGQTKEIPQNF